MRRFAVFAPLALVVSLLAAPTATADLSISVDDSDGYTIDAYGGQSLDAPQNVTITAANAGYRVSWDPPSNVGGLPLTGYTVYRVPGPDQEGQTISIQLNPARTSVHDAWADDADTYVYFVTATYGSAAPSESIPSLPVTNKDVDNYPHCSVASVYTSPPYYDVHVSCLFPLPV
ncbi:MAG: hypothetical protein V4510_09295 [bacterium]